MKNLKMKLLAVLAVLALCVSVVPASASTNASLNAVQSNAAAATWRIPCGSFIQDYMSAYWSDDRWQQELTALKAAGMDTLLLSPSLIKSGNTIKTNYPSKLFPNKDMYGSLDAVDSCLRNCEKAGVKVFIALNQDPVNFWNFGWDTVNTSTATYTQYWKDNAVLSNEVADELYTMYKSKYPDAFYGWYWVHEFWDYSVCTNAYEGMQPSISTAKDPTVITDIIANEAFNPVLDHLTQLDSSMPMLFSSFTNPTYCKPSSVTRFWTDIISKTHFRSGDIWAPMDGMGGSAITLDNLDTWTAATAAAAKANPNLHFWINNEEQIDNPENDDEVSLLNRTVQQISITSKYAENNIFFSWDHMFSPYVTLPGYNETYMQYVKTGAIEQNPPAAVDAGTIAVSKHDTGYRVDWKAPSDDVGIAEYNLYKDGQLVDHIHTHRLDTGYNPVVPTFSFLSASGNYEIEAIDFAGNVSPKTQFTVNDSVITTTTTTTTATTTTTTTTATSTTTTTATSTGTSTTATVTGTTNTTGTTTGTTGVSDVTVKTTTDTAPTDSEVTTTTDTGTTQASNPATGSTVPTAAILFAAVTAGLGFAMKSKRK